MYLFVDSIVLHTWYVYVLVFDKKKEPLRIKWKTT